MGLATYPVCGAGVNSRAQPGDVASGLKGCKYNCKGKGEDKEGEVCLDYTFLDVACCGYKRGVN